MTRLALFKDGDGTNYGRAIIDYDSESIIQSILTSHEKTREGMYEWLQKEISPNAISTVVALETEAEVTAYLNGHESSVLSYFKVRNIT